MNQGFPITLWKASVFLFVLTAFPFAGVCSTPVVRKVAEKEVVLADKAIWTCSMCPQIRQDQPGSCPMCGMDLVPLRSATSSPAESPGQEHENMIHLDPAQTSAGNVGTSPVEERIVQRKLDLFGEISYVTDKQIDFTWFYGGRAQKNLVDYNTTEIKEGTPLMEVYSDEAIADQRVYLEMLMDHWKSAKYEESKMEAQYGAAAAKVRPIGMSYERKNGDAQLHAIEERLVRAGMTPDDFQNLEKTGKVRATFLINAPQSGTLLGALPHVGSRFGTDKVLFSLVPLNEVWFVADVFEQDISLLKLGQEIALRCRTYPDQLFNGKLVFIGREVDPQKRTVKARFLVSNPEGLLLPQLSATGSLEIGANEPQLAVLASALIDTGSRQIVYVETSPGAYALRTVKVGAAGELQADGSTRWVPVLEGLTAGEKVVTSGAFLIDAEAQLRGLPGSGADPAPIKP